MTAAESGSLSGRDLFCASPPASSGDAGASRRLVPAGLGIERMFVRPLGGKPLAAAAVLLALAVAGEGAFRLVRGAAARSVPLRLPVLQIAHVVAAGAALSPSMGRAALLSGLAAATADRVNVLANGRLVFSGSPGALATADAAAPLE